MDSNILIDEMYKIFLDPGLTPNPEYFKQNELSKESLDKIRQINSLITEQDKNLQKLQLLETPLGEQQLKNQLRLNDEMAKSGIKTFGVIDSLKESLEDALSESRNSQRITKVMYILSFILGMALIILAIYFAVQEKTILAIAFGSFGMVDIVAHFITDPPARIQESRSNYVQLTALTLAWFKETINNDSFIMQSSQLTPEAMKNYTDLTTGYVTNTGRFFKMVDDLAEPKSKKSKKEKSKVGPGKIRKPENQQVV